ncbi:MAG TPA: cytidine deaminase [Longimicrobiales bacterium]|nr:cytidine deaminase [Longimicrobiales bacterium]
MEGAEELLRRAREVREHAHAPYSGFRVGAALMTRDGTVHVGSNVENASYGVTLCAERVALGAAVSGGHRRFRALALSSTAPGPVPPCGLCRQALVEFEPDLPVVSEGRDGVAEWTLGALLPEPFWRSAPGVAGDAGPEPAGGACDP